jgi:hypothetical protein
MRDNFGAGRQDNRLVINQPVEGDNAHEPQDSEENRNAVQVPLDDGRRAESRAHPAAEQVGQPAALALVEQHEKDHHETRDDQDNGEPHDHCCYPSPAGDTTPGGGSPTDTGTTGQEAVVLNLLS